MSWHVVAKKASSKLRKLKTLESVYIGENAALLMGDDPDQLNQLDYFGTSNGGKMPKYLSFRRKFYAPPHASAI